MARFCALTGLTPDCYRRLTVRERNAFIDVFNQAAKKSRRK
jgi:hypothetical protein